MKIESYRKLIVWQKSIELVLKVYQLTEKFPNSEIFGLVSQMKRSAVSVPSNISEGYGRRSVKEYLQFYSVGYGSALELETQLIIAQKLGYIKDEEFLKVEVLLTEIIKMLYVMVYKKKGENNSKFGYSNN